MSSRIAPLFLALALTGCPEAVPACTDGRVMDPTGACVAEPGIDSGTPQPDAGRDADGGMDAGVICDSPCVAPEFCADLGGGDTGCVQCTNASHCGGLPCVDNVCAECDDHGDCDDPSRAQCSAAGECVRCALPLHCSARTDGRTVCGDEGTCVECTATERAACGSNACRPDGTCSEFGTAQPACLPCDTDANCGEGLLCVEMSFDDPTPTVVGAVFPWQRPATEIGPPKGVCGLTSQPFAETMPDAMSVDGFEADICTLATTTCPALLQHRTTVTGCNAATDDGACGVDGLRDGRCRLNSGGMPRCTYPCLGTEDCRTGSTCPVAGDQFCSI
jgi:hypothetical protein